MSDKKLKTIVDKAVKDGGRTLSDGAPQIPNVSGLSPRESAIQTQKALRAIKLYQDRHREDFRHISSEKTKNNNRDVVTSWATDMSCSNN